MSLAFLCYKHFLKIVSKSMVFHVLEFSIVKYAILFQINLFLIEAYLLYKIVMVSAINQHESAIGMHLSPPS